VLRLPDGDQVVVPKHLVERSKLLAQMVNFTGLSGSLPVQRELAQSWIAMASSSNADVCSANDSQLTLALQVCGLLSPRTSVYRDEVAKPSHHQSDARARPCTVRHVH
jgi:hypothetical protein